MRDGQFLGTTSRRGIVDQGFGARMSQGPGQYGLLSNIKAERQHFQGSWSRIDNLEPGYLPQGQNCRIGGPSLLYFLLDR